MNIGLPLTDSTTKIMLLGGDDLSKEMTIALQRLEIEVIAVDHYPNAPVQQVAQQAEVIDMTDAEALRQLIEEKQPFTVIPLSQAIAIEPFIEMEAAELVRVIPTGRAFSITQNRQSLRELAAEELDLPTARYAFAQSYNALQMQINRGIGYPCIVKPIMGSSHPQPLIIKGPEDVKAAWEEAMRSSPDSCESVIVEEWIQFDYEISLLTVRSKAGAGEIETQFCEPIGYLNKPNQAFESWQPQRMTPNGLHHARQMAKTVTDNLGGLGLFEIEYFVKGDKMWFNDVRPFPHYSGMITLITQAQNQFDLHARASLGLPVSTSLQHQGACKVIDSEKKSNERVFEGIEEALQVPTTDLRLFAQTAVKGYQGMIFAQGQSIHEAKERTHLAARKIRVV
jgi:phosphoribosylglycinamide formyltransferase 2